MKIKAAVHYEFHKPLVIEEVEIDPPGDNDVLIKISATGICHSDVHCKHAEHGNHPLPGIGGHEVCGFVEEVGKAVNYVQPGDKVIASIMHSGCGHCYYCMIGAPYNCEAHKISLIVPGRYTNDKGQRLTQWQSNVAGFAEYTVVPEWNVVKISADFPDDLAALISCGVVSGYGAVLNRAKVQPNQSVVVIGTGGVGLNAVQGARFVGAHPIIAIDILDSKLETARAFGATHTINAKKSENVHDEVLALTYGRGADQVIMATRGLELLRQGFDMSAVSRTTCVIGHGAGEKMEMWEPRQFCGGRKITGSAIGAIRPRVDIPRIIELYQHGRFKLDELVSGHYKFEQINEAFESMEQGNVIRNVLTFD